MRFSRTRNVLLCAGVVFGGVLLVSVYNWVGSLTRLSPFLVRAVEVRWMDSVDPAREWFRLAPPTSVFRVNLRALDRDLQDRYPTARVEAVRRILPNRVVAELVSKRVIAQVKTGRYYPVSVDGTVLMEGASSPWPELPVVRFALYKADFEAGQICEHPDFPQVSRLLTAIYRSGGLSGHPVSEVRFKPDRLVLEVDSGAEIWLDPGKLEENWNRLTALLKNKPAVLNGAAYLDLRFENPTIAKKGAIR